MVPAPTTAAVRIGVTGVSFGTSGTRAAARSAKKTWMSALACEGEPRGGLDGVDRPLRRQEPAPLLLGRRPRRGDERRVLRLRAQLLVALAGPGVRRPRSQPLPEEADGALQEVPLDDGVHDAVAVGLGGLDRVSLRAHLQGLADAGQPGQPLGPAGAGDDPELDLRLAHLRGRHRDPVVAGHGDLEAAAESRAVDRTHDRLREVLEGAEERGEAFAALLLAGGDLLELLDVGAGDERLARADQDEPLHRPVAPRGLEGGVDPFRDAGADRVHRRVVDGDDADLVASGEGDELHRAGLERPPRGAGPSAGSASRSPGTGGSA
jgi:hypothetical protein